MQDREATKRRHGTRLAWFAAGLTCLLSAALPAPRAAFGSMPPSGRAALTLRRAGAACSVDVAYAGSLQYLAEKVIGPAFSASSGCSYEGEGAGAYALAHEIIAKEVFPSVFLSVGSGPINQLRPTFTRWSVELAADPLVLAYNPHSPYAARFVAVRRHRASLASLFEAMARPGFRIGRTDPATDPQGQAFVMMVQEAETTLHLPVGTATRVLGGLENPTEIFAETALESYLEAGQLDAASAYRAQAVELHLPYVALPDSMNFGEPADSSDYAAARLTLATGHRIHGTPLVIEATSVGKPTLGAERFLAYLLSRAGRSDFQKGGFSLVSPVLLGHPSVVPALVRSALHR